MPRHQPSAYLSQTARHLANPFIATVYVLYMAGMGTCMGSVMTSALRTLADNQQTEGNAIL
ncbi:hypothetical protein EFQ43_04490, partial [Limosilactobacillus fermentum]|nr:hypothetical protein [Limosilactobacillus fermentum]